MLGAVLFERIPPGLTGRVTALEGAVCWSLLPFGGLLGGLVVDQAGLTPALLPGLGPLLVIILGLVAVFSSFVQIMLMWCAAGCW